MYVQIFLSNEFFITNGEFTKYIDRQNIFEKAFIIEA